MELRKLLDQFDFLFLPPNFFSIIAVLLTDTLVPVQDAVNKAEDKAADSQRVAKKYPDVIEPEHVLLITLRPFACQGLTRGNGDGLFPSPYPFVYFNDNDN